MFSKSGIISLIGKTPLLKLNNTFSKFNGYAKLEMFNSRGIMKDRSALNMVLKAWENGEINSGTTIIESNSGNLAVGLAQVCKFWGLRLICVVDANTNVNTIKLLKVYGAEVDVITEPDKKTGEFLYERIKRVEWLHETTGNIFWCSQYANLNNPLSYNQLMQKIIEQLGKNVDYLFIAVSTCGTLRGCYDYIKEYNPNTKIIAIDAKGSVIFSKEQNKRYIHGHGTGRLPELFQDGMDYKHICVSDRDCVDGCYHLLDKETLLVGGSSGGIVTAIKSLEDEIPGGVNCVAIFADSGERYLDTIYSKERIKSKLGEEYLKVMV